ncbi:alkane 1-monooxygenase, partial [Klebsiella grimontii]|nr:alkane 1-monooxygenase [Klebsiella grimontii]
ALQSAWNIDEFIIDTPISDGAARLNSLRLLARAHLSAEVQP